MRLEEILKIENGMTSARELRTFLEIKRRFSVWIDQYIKENNKYGFEEYLDFTGVRVSTVVNNGAEIGLDDYNITLDMAKEISMITGTNKGKEARKYFIQAEKQLIAEREEKLLIQAENERLRAELAEAKIKELECEFMELTHSEKIHLTTERLYPILRLLGVADDKVKEAHKLVYRQLTRGKYENITRADKYQEDMFVNAYRQLAESIKESGCELFGNEQIELLLA